MASFSFLEISYCSIKFILYLLSSSFRLNLVLSIYKLDQHQRNQELTIEEESNKLWGMEKLSWMHQLGFSVSPFVTIIMLLLLLVKWHITSPGACKLWPSDLNFWWPQIFILLIFFLFLFSVESMWKFHAYCPLLKQCPTTCSM